MAASAVTSAGTRASARAPFRADVVGSFIRPAELNAARERLLGPQTPDRNLGPHDNAELRAVEDDCVRQIVAMQERAGLQSATDGEFRRRSWWLDLIMGWKGFAADRHGTTEMMWRNKDGTTQAFSRLWVTGPIEWQPSATVRAFAFLKSATTLVPKVTLPAPILVHMYGCGNKGILEGHYSDLDNSGLTSSRLTGRKSPRWSRPARRIFSLTIQALRFSATRDTGKPWRAGARRRINCWASMPRR